MLTNLKSLLFFTVLFCLSIPNILLASIFTDTSSCCDITFHPDGKISVGRNYNSNIASDFNASSIGDTLINKKLKQPYKQKYGVLKISNYKQVNEPVYNNRFTIIETFKDNTLKDKVFEFYSSIQNTNFSNSSETKNSYKQLYKF